MKIIVCIKQVPGTNEVKMDPVTNTIIRENIESIINPFDTYAIEEAVRIKENMGAEVIGLSMGIPAAEEILREAISLGIDKGFLLSDRKFAGADTLATSYTLSLGVKKIKDFDLIICGKQASDGDTAQVGPSLAKTLGIAYVTDISKIIEINENNIRCMKITDDGYEEILLTLPALITVVKEINMPRLPSIKRMKIAQDSQVEILTFNDVEADENRLGLKGSPTQVRKTFIPIHNINNEMIEGSEKAEKLASILLGKIRRS
ncbi:MAG: electron transfer flavoprotein subunit beta/FixA family protein [Tissierellia bacterium]|nr:electron transfer flavoprotein subunit beta/FixA family protein [Tissierellia bacterium]MDD4780395.1 electron transfer flavoprotein subunit beta/FixA family protein [Tissierellia bacterium]